MNCHGCGTQLTDKPSPDAVNQAVDEVLLASITDARRRGGVCPLCGHSHNPPFFRRRGFYWALLAVLLMTAGLGLAVSMYLRSPMRTSLVQGAIARAAQDLRVMKLLGAPVEAGSLSSGGINTDGMGWSEAELLIPLSGPFGSASLHIIAGRGEGPWIISALDVWAEKDAQTINLLHSRVEIGDAEVGVSVKSEPAAAPDLLDLTSIEARNDGSHPVIRVAMGPLPVPREYATSRISHLVDGAEDSSEVDLRTGVFVLRRTDLMIEDSIPLVFTRVFHTVGAPNTAVPGNWIFRPGENHPAFGFGTSHTYDICPMGASDTTNFMNLQMADGESLHFVRISRGLEYKDAWYQQLDVSSEFYKARLWWNGLGWTLALEDGTTYLFPESYDGMSLAQGAPFEMRDSQGERLQMFRDGRRNLRRLVSPGGRSITLEYNGSGLIRKARDDAGHQVDYSYDSLMRLILVRDSHGPLFRYTYDATNPDKMVTVENGEGQVLLRNVYNTAGRVTEQIFADGRRFGYAYVADGFGQVTQTVVTMPDGTKSTFNFENGGLVVPN